MKTYKTFEVDVYSKKPTEYGCVKCRFVCLKSEAKHRKLKDFANGSTYWFEGLKGSNWSDGGFYDYGTFGFINASLELKDNVQGVVYQNEVYLLKSIELI